MIKMRSSVLRGHWVAISLLLFIFISAPTHVAAKMDLPPLLNSEEDYRQYIERLKNEVPEVVTGRRPVMHVGGGSDVVLAFVRREQALLRRLLNDSRYLSLVEQRPDLQVFEVRKVSLSYVQGPGLRGWEEFLRAFSWPTSSVETVNELRQTLSTIQAHSSSAFFAALAQILPEDLKVNLRNPDLRARWLGVARRLSEVQIQRLRETLRPEVFGLRPGWTMADLNQLVEEMATQEDRLVHLIQALHTPTSRPQESWLLSEDWDEVLDDLDLSVREVKFIEGLRSRYRKKFLDSNVTLLSEVPQRSLKLREAPPFHAIFRGCVGADCSTDNSWSYPYSPLERYWWIEDESGRRLGYVSGAITTFQGRPCLYIRDVTGPHLISGDVTLILHGFFLAKEFFGAEQMTIMPIEFIPQNHFHLQRDELQRYPNRQRVTQEFGDEWIRNEYLQRADTSNQYDSVTLHSNARWVVAHSDMNDVRVERLSTESTERSEVDELWAKLTDAVIAWDSSALLRLRPEIDWSAILDRLKNEAHLPTQEFYRSVEHLFQTYELPFSRNLMKKFEAVFAHGHLNARDAFSDGKAIKKTIRYLQDLIWRQNNKELAGEYIQSNLQLLENNPSWIHLLEGLFSRRGAEDAARIQFLWERGCRFTGIHLNDEAVIWLLGQARSADVANWALEASIQAHNMSPEVAEAVAARLENEDESIPEEISIWVARKYFEIPEFILRAPLALLEAQASIEGEENVQILFPLAIAYVRDMPSDDPFIKTALKALKQHVGDESLPRSWKQKARRLLSAKASLLEEDCEDRLTRGRGNG